MTLAELTRRESGTTLSILSVPTFLRVIGAGPPVFVLHGGPGFTHDYLVAPLRSLSARRTLIFFDQPGCGCSGQPDAGLTPAFAAEHFRALVREIVAPGETAGVVAHSWGAFVCLASDVPPHPHGQLTEGVLVAPVSPTRTGWDAAVAQLVARVPPSIATPFLTSLASDTDTDFGPLLPFYCAKPPLPESAALRVRGATYLATVDRLGDYDLRPQARRILPVLDLVLGRFDLTAPDLFADLGPVAHRHAVLDTGHFPFWEDPVGFERVLEQAFA